MTQSVLTPPAEQGWLTTPAGLSAPAPRRLLAPEPRSVPQAQDLSGVGLLIGIAAAVWFATRKESQPTEPPSAPGAARVAGSIGAIQVAPTAQAAQIAKDIGGPAVSSRFAWFGKTTNAAGSPIAWPYAVLVRIGHGTLFTGWKQASPDLGFPSTSGQVFHTGPPLQGETARTFSWLVPDDPDQVWDIRVWLFALRSDENGFPIGDPTSQIGNDPTLNAKVESVGPWMGLAFGQLEGAFRSVAPDFSASVSGSLGIITVKQATTRRIGSLERSPLGGRG